MSDITDRAIKAIQNVLSEGDNLRIGVRGGGCSGLSYSLTSEDPAKASLTDFGFEKDGLRVVIDSKSLEYLKGTVLDFDDGLSGKGFEFNNPNATQSCGCGSSFSA